MTIGLFATAAVTALVLTMIVDFLFCITEPEQEDTL